MKYDCFYVPLKLLVHTSIYMAKCSSFFSGIGKHVSVQPPAALGQNETLRMVQAAQYYPALLSVIQVHSLKLKIVDNFCFKNLFL
jgi:hypothetical protein